MIMEYIIFSHSKKCRRNFRATWWSCFFPENCCAPAAAGCKSLTSAYKAQQHSIGSRIAACSECPFQCASSFMPLSCAVKRDVFTSWNLPFDTVQAFRPPRPLAFWAKILWGFLVGKVFQVMSIVDPMFAFWAACMFSVIFIHFLVGADGVGHCFIVSSKIAGYLRLLFELAGARWC